MVARTEGGSVSAAGRKASKSKGHTFPGTDKFPIDNLTDLKNAKHDIGRSSLPRGPLVSYINRRARALGGRPVGGEKPEHHFAHGRPRTE